MLDELNDHMRAWSTHLHFEFDKSIGKVIVTVLDAETGDTLRTIPSDEMLKIARMMVELQRTGVQTTA